ncbi:MAG: ribosome maturation factor RimP [Thermodesulfobacteriota bacterium]
MAQTKSLAQRLCDAEGLELVHVEFQREAGGRILRLYIDQPGGVTLNDCVNISRQMGDLLDVSIDNIGPYNLEVSSPGTDRPLSKESDYERFKGNIAKIKTTTPIGGQKNFKGVLSGISGGMVSLKIGDRTVAIPFQEIARARLVDYHGESQC